MGKENENPSRFYNFAGFKNGKETIDFTFTKFKYKYSALDSKIETEIKIINKSFIKKNKYRIIRSDFFKKYEICDIGYHILNNGKIFYIIDLTERIRGKTKAYEVIASQVCNKEDNN